MSETKQEKMIEVFAALLWEAEATKGTNDARLALELMYWRRYRRALPDNMATIPKDVGEKIAACKGAGKTLRKAMTEVDSWLGKYFTFKEGRAKMDAFARAWVDQAWIVKESGKVERV